MKQKVLVVEDDASILAGLIMNLEMEGYEALAAADGATAIDKHRAAEPDLVILDIMLPQKNGFEVLDAIRAHDPEVPVLILSARDHQEDKVLGLNLGADDYITKPFDIAELLARVRASLRRRRKASSGGAQVGFGEVVVDADARQIVRDGTAMEVSSKEFDLLVFLMNAENRAMTRQQILDGVWGNDYFGTDRTVDNFIAKLRTKLESDPESPQHLQTVRGIGYRFVRNP